VTSETKFDIHAEIDISPTLKEAWQRTIDVLAAATNVPAALIMRVHHREIEVFLKSAGPDNVYETGERADLDTGLYCETVMASHRELMVPNALVDPAWDQNPDIDLNMISYCGLPLLWPTGRVFGTICILDNKENPYSDLCRDLLGQFRTIIEEGLRSQYDAHQLNNTRRERERESRELEREIDQRTRELEAARTDAGLSQKTLYAVINSIPAMINAKDRDYRYVFMNQYQAKLYGTTPAAAVGATAFDLVGPEYGAATQAIDEEIFETNRPHPNYEESWLDREGNIRTLLTTKVPLDDATGTPTNIVTVSLDITDRKRAETAVLAAKEEAEAASRTKSEFLAQMSHDFRTPLNAILGFSEILLGEHFGSLGNEKYREYARGVFDSGTHMLELVNDILNVSSIETGKRSISKEAHCLADLLDGCLWSFRPAATDKNVKLLLEPPDPALMVKVDRTSFIQIMNNLVANAIKYTDRNGIITIAVNPTECMTRIEVRDTGAGIPTDLLPVVTEPFARNHANPHLVGEGMGLGLSIVKSLVKAHDGKLNIDSAVGQGTTVTVSFPV